MFFFFIGGLQQQVRQVLKSGAGQCINCGSKADIVEYDKVLKLFFVPVWRWPAKDPLLHCNDCRFFFPQSFSSAPVEVPDPLRCQACARSVASDFRPWPSTQ